MMTVCTTVVSVDRLNRARQIQVKNEQFLTSRPQCYKALQRDWTCPLLLVLSSLTLVHFVPQSQKPTRQLRIQGLNPVEQQCHQSDRNHTEHYHHLSHVRHLAYRSVHSQRQVTLDYPQRHGCRKQARLLFTASCVTLSQTLCMPLFAPST